MYLDLCLHNFVEGKSSTVAMASLSREDLVDIATKNAEQGGDPSPIKLELLQVSKKDPTKLSKKQKILGNVVVSLNRYEQ